MPSRSRMRKTCPRFRSCSHGSPAFSVVSWIASRGSRRLSMIGMTGSLREQAVGVGEAAQVLCAGAAARVVLGRGAVRRIRAVRDQLHGLRRIVRTRIERMRRGRERRERVHLEAQVERAAGRRMAGDEIERAVVARVEPAEEVDVRGEIARRQAVFRELEHEAVAAVADHRVAIGLVRGRAVLVREQPRIADAAERVVPAERVGRDRCDHAPHVRIQRVAAREVRGVLRLQRVGHVVAFERIFLAMKDGGQVRAAVDIDDAQREAAAQDAGPVGSCGDQRFPRDVWRWNKDGDGLGARRHGGSVVGWTKGVRGRPNDIATSRAFIPPWSLAVSSNRGEGKTGLLSDQSSRGANAARPEP
ncbi:hypothetical protein BDI4_20068 [Burkholderia diffusa]|nr:hypothetical protein BDI4_20068 [Burkholderia diffusa]